MSVMPPKLNPILMSSLMMEVQQLDSLAKEITESLSSSTLRNVDNLFSWKFPSTKASNVEVIEMLKEKRHGTAGEMYILLLELAYDRIHFVLRLMIEFTRNNATWGHFHGDESMLSDEIVQFWNECTSTVSSTARMVWEEFKRKVASSNANLYHKRRIASLDEYRISLANKLSMTAESKMALEKTILKIRREINMLRQRCERNNVNNGTADVLQFEELHDSAVRGVLTTDAITTATSNNKNKNKEERKESSLVLLTPKDDPLVDMTRELLSNREKIDRLLRQNDRISRLINRISEYRRDGVSNGMSIT